MPRRIFSARPAASPSTFASSVRARPFLLFIDTSVISKPAPLLCVHVRSEGTGAGFEITEVAIKSRKGRARTDDAKVDGEAAGLRDKILRGIHQFPGQTRSR